MTRVTFLTLFVAAAAILSGFGATRLPVAPGPRGPRRRHREPVPRPGAAKAENPAVVVDHHQNSKDVGTSCKTDTGTGTRKDKILSDMIGSSTGGRPPQVDKDKEKQKKTTR